ncbi:hypothetical protein Poli38472_010971 [Pythium oligandrum]|uniref:Uncharacterized protein n=1 Tax=Pythium oligandrum TaxID=41045 RepID=A0A8K1CF66_PYTOL|nr:hypothetical protein Poli38472_010971 [Pythium oligandrum]|eukprot:TMW61908.1 hypothetical protein Poli38472_010971 [Pythium oligandrum]
MWLRVVATTASPPFKLISFRRATAAAITAIEEMPSPVGQAKMSAAPAQLTKPAGMAGESTLRGVLLPSLPAMTRQARTQELVFLFSAVEQIQARGILGCADKIFKIHDATLDFQTNMSLTGSSCLRKWLELLVLTGNEERCRHEAWTSSSLVVTLSLVAAWCSFDVEFNRTVHQFVRVGSKQVLNRDALHAVFEELVSWVWVKLDEYLRCLNWSLPALLQKLIVIFPATSIGSHESAFHSYPAQVREGVVDQNVRLDRHPGSFEQPNNTKNSSFSGIWTMGLQDVHLRRLEPSYDGSAGVQPLTLTTLLAFQRQLATISTSFSPSNQHFSLVSLLFAEKGTQLRLDMRDRWFRRFPAVPVKSCPTPCQQPRDRTNLPRGAKILRCFPHCCPDHLPRGFCGSSLTIRVEFTVPQADYVIPAGLFVFGRFHLSHSAEFRVGDRFKLSDITASLQYEDSPRHSWVAANELPSASMNTWLFELSPSARWFYNWDSGVAKKRRLQAHALSVAALTPILRCFPHCCPGHMDRSFCGSPLRVRVDGQANALSTETELLVLARFRLAQSQDLNVGDCIATSDISASLQSDSNPNGEWIAADEQIDCAQNCMANTHPIPSNSFRQACSRFFLLNPTARWFYTWESGVAKAHRLQQHTLSVVVVAPVRLSSQSRSSGAKWLRIVAVLSSPPFKLISFRRATQAAISAIEEMSGPGSSSTKSTKVSEACGRPRKSAATLLECDSSCDSTPRVASLPSMTAIARPARVQGLALIFTAVGRLQVRDILGWLDELFRIYDSTLAGRLNQTKPPPCSLRQWLEPLVLPHKDDRYRYNHQTPSPLVTTLSSVAAWVCFDVEFNRIVNQFVLAGAKYILDRDVLHVVFEELVSWVWDKLDRYLRRLNWSMAALVHELMTKSPPNAVSNDIEVGYHRFLVQVRECVVDQNQNGRVRHVEPGLHIEQHLSTSFSGTWSMRLEEMQLRRLDHANEDTPAVPSLALTTLLTLRRQLGTINTTYDSTKSQFSITSLPFAQDATQMQLRLDTRDRWFRHFPAGESTLAVGIHGYSFGDYVGSHTPQRGEYECECELHWNLYAWPEDDENHVALCFHVHVTASRDGASLGVVVQVIQGDIDADTRRLVTFSTLSLREKLCLVPHWTLTLHASWIHSRRS